MTRAVAKQWHAPEYVANGRRPIFAWPIAADNNSDFLAAEWSYTVTHNMGFGGGAVGGATVSEYPFGTPGQLRVRIPPWTRYVGWSAVGGASGAVYVRRAEVDGLADVGSWSYLRLSIANGMRQIVTAYQVDTSEPDPQAAGALHTNIFDGSWHDLTIEFYCDSTVAVNILQFHPMPVSYTGERIG